MKQARKKIRMTLRQLGEQTEISPSRLCDLENRRAEPTSDEVDKLGMILGTEIKFAGMEESYKNSMALKKQVAALQAVYDEVKRRGLGKGNGGSGTMPCPKCGATLGFSVAAINGHVWGKCSTKGCLAWMQ